MPGVRPITFTLETLIFPAPYDFSAVVSNDSPIDITSRIEDPVRVNRFTAPDIQLSGYDSAALGLITRLQGIQPTSAFAFIVRIYKNGVPCFVGNVIPQTVTVDLVQRAWSFSSASVGANLITGADNVLPREPLGWIVADDAMNTDYVHITKSFGPPPTESDFQARDVVKLTVGTKSEEATVSKITTVTSGLLTLFFSPKLSQIYPAGTPIELVTKHQRNVLLRDAVDALYAGAALPATIGNDFRIAPIGDGTTVFSTPLGVIGLQGVPRAVIPAGDGFPSHIQTMGGVGTPVGLWLQAAPPGGTFINEVPAAPGRTFELVDPTPRGTGKYYLNGPRRDTTRVAINQIETRVYAYDYSPPVFAPPHQRFILRVKVQEDTGFFEWDIRRQTTNDLVTWSAETILYAGANGSVNLDAVEDHFNELGCEFFDSKVYFTEPYVAVVTAGRALRWRVSTLFPPGAVYTANVITPNTAEDARGVLFAYSTTKLGFFQLWQEGGHSPVLRTFTITPSGFTELFPSIPLPFDFQPFTLKLNAGISPYRYVGLSASSVGVKLLPFDIYPPVGYVPPPFFNDPIDVGAPGLIEDHPNIFAPPVVDLAVIKDVSRPTGGGTIWPMVGLFGNTLWWIDFTSTDNVEYADFDGISCAEALGQLAIAHFATYHVSPTGRTFFKTRTLDSTRAVGVPDVLDDGGCVGIPTFNPIGQRGFLYIKVTNERDETVFGEAGNPAYAGTAWAIEIKNRFVTTPSYAKAVATRFYTYLGLDAFPDVVLEHYDDGRDYGLENTFHLASKPGILFQITESGDSLLGRTIKLVGAAIPGG